MTHPRVRSSDIPLTIINCAFVARRSKLPRQKKDEIA